MEETKKQSALRAKTARMVDRFSNRFLMIRSFTTLTLFAASYVFFAPLLRTNSDLARLFLILYGLFIIVLSAIVFIEFLIKTVRLQNADAKNYSALTGINTLLGVALPLFYANAIFATVIKALSQMAYWGTYACEIRCNLVRFYDKNQIFFTVNNLIYLLVVVALLLIIVGGFIENLVKANRK
jgi:hypothetical protein